jgi:hypothetical protein|tara:strand:+ start:2803 stop:3162 length:360 start_codon:yes stop_codon:yes gene_type:complete
MPSERAIKELIGTDDLKEISGRLKGFRTFIDLIKKDAEKDDGGIIIPKEHQKAFSDQIGQLIGKDMPLLIAMIQAIMNDNVLQMELLRKVAMGGKSDFDDLQTEIISYLSSVTVDEKNL